MTDPGSAQGMRRLELFQQADRMAIVAEAAVIPLVYGRNMAFVRPGVEGWWEFASSRPPRSRISTSDEPASPGYNPRSGAFV